MQAPQEIVDLVTRFREQFETYKSPNYNETQVRREFVDPFFKALGWDVENTSGYAVAYKDVIHEDSVKIGGATKAPDYSFRIGGVRKFFVETKKPYVNIRQDTSPAYQLRRYAWSAKLPVSILTDFEEFAVYDCRIRPQQNDAASKGRVLYLKFDQYEEKWDEIASVFSRDAILKGSFDKYADSNKRKRGTAEVDDAFLDEIEGWRNDLAKNIARKNEDLSQRALNEAVQKTIDRIIFLRICEDRGMETYGRLAALVNGPKVYERLRELFQDADTKYNSGLFHFHKEKGRKEAPDEWTLGLVIDDSVLKPILKRLYYPDSPYEFSVLPADILGQVYEQFLGKVIRLTPGHRAIVEDKPEVKKAGGVYYTPTYVVDYIVHNTIGKLVEGKRPYEVAGLTEKYNASKNLRPISVLDPACGSGSFLIGAYQFLLDWYRDRYVEEGPAKHKQRIYQTRSDVWRLTTNERKRILLDHIYGVDIDAQAVEVTKLSLLLKVLEGETQESLRPLLFAKQRALPDLAGNIKCGNSLVGPDFFHDRQMDLFNEDEIYRINVFDWNAEFKDVMSSSGFDAVIGNPPYGFHQIHEAYLKPYYQNCFACTKGSFEHYFIFYERSLLLLRPRGIHGFIVPVTWLTIPSGKSLRKFVLDGYRLVSIDWLPELVFKKAQVNTLVSIISAEKSSITDVRVHGSLGFTQSPKESRSYHQSDFQKSDYYVGIFENAAETNIIHKLEQSCRPLKDFARPCSGYNPYEVGKGVRPGGGPHNEETVRTKPYHSKKRINDSWSPEIVGRDLSRYYIPASFTRWVQYGSWLSAPRNPNNFCGHRILIQEIVGGKSRRIVAAYCEETLYHSRDVIPVKVDTGREEALFLLGIINSRLVTWYHQKRNPKAKKGLFPKLLVSDISKFPVKDVSESRNAMVLRNKIIASVERMQSARIRESEAKASHERLIVERQIAATDREIDMLVYELYGLTDEEIHIVEEATGN